MSFAEELCVQKEMFVMVHLGVSGRSVQNDSGLAEVIDWKGEDNVL